MSKFFDENASDLEKQEVFLDYYRQAKGKQKMIKNVCEALELPRWEFDLWLADPEFEEKFWSLRKAHSYELEEQLTTISSELLEPSQDITKGRFYALTIAQKSILELIGKLNRERFGESTEVRLKQEGNIQPSISISLVQAPNLALGGAFDALPSPTPTLTIEQAPETKKEAIEAPLESKE